MESKRKALGRGLEELFSNERLDVDVIEKKIVEETSKEEIIEVELKDLRSNPHQPRKVFDEKALEELATSIKEHGIIQPIIIKKSIKGYEIVAGERRVKASKIAGLKTIPAIVRDFSDQQMMELALLENLQRENLSIIEEAEAYSNLLESLDLTQEELAQRLGKSRSHITNMIGLLRLPEKVKDLIMDKKLSMGHARVLSKLEDADQIEELADQVVRKDLSVRELENMTKNEDFKRKVTINRKENTKAQEYYPIQEQLRETLGTKVNITDKKVEIYFASTKDLNRILEIMNLSEE